MQWITHLVLERYEVVKDKDRKGSEADALPLPATVSTPSHASLAKKQAHPRVHAAKETDVSPREHHDFFNRRLTSCRIFAHASDVRAPTSAWVAMT